MATPLGGNSLEPCILEDFFGFWADQNHITTGSNVIRREIIEIAGYQRADLRISEDLEYWGYLATFGKWGFIPKALWVGDPIPSAAAQGWQVRHKKRYQFCPTVEQWEKRIIPRLKTEDWPGFRKVRGRVASSYAQAKIIAGDDEGAIKIVSKYGEDMPVNYYTQSMKIGVRSGWLGWRVVCSLIRFREQIKSFLINFGRRDPLKSPHSNN
jgi:hypothetical protein